MIEALAIGTMGGLMFQCAGPDGFAVFAPDAEATAGYMGDVRRLYRYERLGEGAEEPENFGQVLDMLPDSLSLSWRVTNNSPVQLAILDHDAEAGTARYELSFETRPEARNRSMVHLGGSCEVRRVQEERPQ